MSNPTLLVISQVYPRDHALVGRHRHGPHETGGGLDLKRPLIGSTGAGPGVPHLLEAACGPIACWAVMRLVF